MRILWTAMLLVVVIVLVGAWTIYSGTVNVAARPAGSGFLDWMLDRTQTHAVSAHAARAGVPDLGQASVPVGAAHYREMCVTCHGGPGIDPSEIGRGLNPSPPDLVQSAKELKPREIYWIVKNGIRMTGMPSFGVTHDEEELSAMTAFVLRLPGMSPQEFQALADAGERVEGPHASETGGNEGH